MTFGLACRVGAAGFALVIAACQPPPAQSPCPPQTVYVAAPAVASAGGDQAPNPYPVSEPTEPSPTGSQADIAEQLDREGQDALTRRQYQVASSKFRNAAARVPLANYFHHLCQSLFNEGKFSEALTACHAVEVNNPAADLKRINDALTRRILDEARKQGVNVTPDPRGAAGARPAPSGTQAEIATKLDADGQQLLLGGQFTRASAKFREAVARVPEAKYFLHLCTSLYQEGKFSEALTSCDAVGKNYPPPDIQRKADVLSQKIKDEARAQGINVTSP